MAINVCIVGLGHAAKIHAEGYKNNKYTELIGVLILTKVIQKNSRRIMT